MDVPISSLKFSNPTYGISGIPIVTQKHLRAICPEGYGDELRTTDSWQRANYGAVLQQNNLLFYSVGAYLGKTNIWLNSDKAVPASFLTLLRCQNERNAGFLQVLLNSRYGILQSKCFQSGTSQQYIYPKDIRKFLVPAVDDKLKKRLHRLVVESLDKGLEAKNLIDQAKTRVEQLIEEAVRS
jgi:type I restriction enzyme S subunit